MSLYTRIIDLQKLDAGLQKVLKNKPAPGADGITYDMFEANKKEYLKQLHLELQEHRYQGAEASLCLHHRCRHHQWAGSRGRRGRPLIWV